MTEQMELKIFNWGFFTLLFFLLNPACNQKLDNLPTRSSSIRVEIKPKRAELQIGQIQDFEATQTSTRQTAGVEGAIQEVTEINGNASVFDWVIQEGEIGGTLKAATFSPKLFRFIASDKPGTYHVRVQSKEDPKQFDLAEVVILPP